MIFSKFFKAKWQNSDANVRLNAITHELSPDIQEQRDILISLAKNDENDNVRKGALLKVDDIGLWLSALDSKNSAIETFAQKHCQKLLSENNQFFDQTTKVQLIDKLPKTYLEAWLLEEENIDITKALYKKIAKPQLAISLFARKQNEAFQLFLLENIDDTAILEKLAKKSSLAPVQQFISTRIAQAVEAKEKPIKLASVIQLLLSKLLALKENNSDYEIILAKRSELLAQWAVESKELACLTPEQQATFTQKYEAINLQLDSVFAQKAELYQQEQIARQLEQEKRQASTLFIQQIKQCEQTLANAVFENIDLTDDSAFKESLTLLTEQIEASVLNNQEQSELMNTVNKLQKKLKQLPIIAQSVTDATHLISRVSQLALPTSIDELNERYEIFEDFKKQWRTVEKQSIGTLPDSIKSAKTELVKQWNDGIAPLLAEQKVIFNHARKNIIDIKRLIANGKFNPCFSVYKKLKNNVESLSAQQMQKLQRDYTQITEKMTELADWEHYIATPRKQELLDQIKALVATPLDNPNEQATKVKEYRKHWNALGHADDEVEKSLNDEFNQACEQAFAPCRLFYAEQEKIREQHALARQKVIAQVQELADEMTTQETVNFKDLDGQLNKLHKAWRDAGDVDRAQYQKLQKQYNNALAPLKAAIQTFQSNNAELKEAIINKAEACLAQENVFDAINEVKQLQVQWRTIGYAGARKDNNLWQSFRKINDAIFVKRDELKQQQQQQQASIKEDVETQLTAITTALNNAKVFADYQELLDKTNSLLQEITQQKPVIKALAIKAEKTISQINSAITTLQSSKTKQDWQRVFNIIDLLVNAELTTLEEYNEYSLLPSFWQKKLSDVVNKNKIGDRASKTLELEILGGIDSPEELAQQRMSTQVMLMQQQMQSGGTVDLQALFIDWLLVGKFTQEDKTFVQRVKPLYC